MALLERYREQDLDEDQIDKLNTLFSRFNETLCPNLKRKQGRQQGQPQKRGGKRGGEWGMGGDGETPEEKEGLVVRVGFDFENDDFEETTQVTRIMCMQFLVVYNCDVDKASEALTETIKWRINAQPHLAVLDSPQMGGLRRKEMMWWKHKDIHGRPALLLFGGRRRTDLETSEEKVRHFYWVLESAATMSEDGQFLVIFDLMNLGYSNIEIETLKYVAPLYINHFPERLGKLVFVFTPYLFYAGWQVLKLALDARTLAKITITSDNGAEALLPYFTPETLPRRYGGECDDEVLESHTYSLTTPDFLVREREGTEEEKEKEKEKEKEIGEGGGGGGWFW